MKYGSENNPVDELLGKKNENITTESNQNTNDIKENIELPDNNKTIINDYDQTNYEQNMNIDNNDNNFNYGISNSENKNFNKHKLFLLFGLILFIVIVIGIIIFIIKVREQKEEIKREVEVLTDSIDIKAVGFQFDEPFDKNKFEYNLEIDTKKVQIKCSRYERVEGCNQVVDLSDKNSYDHIIKYSTLDDKEYIYTIHINKKGTSGPIKIDSVEINETKHTNDENKIVVNAESENNKKLQYSFDGGNTWQNSNQYETKENEEVNIVIKDEDGNKTEDKIVEIDNIDKIPPTVDIIVKEKTMDKIVLQANAKDEASGIDSYNWNNSGYTNISTYEVTKAGTYTVIVKDKAGNTSSKASITVPDSAFNKEAKKESKTYTVKLVGNGASIEKAQLTCSTYELSCTVKLPNITRENGIIIGFAESASATTAKYNVGEEITLTGNKTLYAITAKKVTVTFEKNGANSVSYTSKSCNIYNTNKTCKIKSPIITKIGWTILGFAESSDATTAKYKVSSNITIDSNKKYYAITRKTLTATFEKNGASNLSYTSKSCNIYNTNTECTIKTPTITRSGWTILGFAESASATTAKYKVSSNITISSNKKYYAVTLKSLTATFEKNGASTLSYTSKSCNIYNTSSSCNVTTPTITRSGWTILGFAESASATTEKYKVSSNIAISSNKKYYAITKQKESANIKLSKITSVSELTPNLIKNSHNSLWKNSSLELNKRELYGLSSDILGERDKYYPRIKKMKNGKYILFYQNASIGMSIRYTISKNNSINLWNDPKIIFRQNDNTTIAEYPNRKARKSYTNADAIVLNDGTILVVATFRTWLESNETSKSLTAMGDFKTINKYSGLVLKYSMDNGATWSNEQVIYNGYNWEPYLLQKDNNTVQVYFSQTAIDMEKYNLEHSSGVGMITLTRNGTKWNSDSKKISGKNYTSTKTVIRFPAQICEIKNNYPYCTSNSNTRLITKNYNNIDKTRLTGQMPSVIKLNNGKLAAAVESVFRTRSGTYKNSDGHMISFAYNNSFDWPNISDEKYGPADRKEFQVWGAAPYIRQFKSGEVVLGYSKKKEYTLQIADSNMKEFSKKEYYPLPSADGYWGTIEIDNNVLISAMHGDSGKKIYVSKSYLNHAITVESQTINGDGNAQEWKTQQSLFIGSNSKTQALYRFAKDSKNLYIAIETLDEKVDDNDSQTIYIGNTGSDYYKIIVTPNGLKSANKGKTNINNITAKVQKLVTNNQNNNGYVAEITIPLSLIGDITKTRICPILYDNNNGKDMIENVTLSDFNTWIPLK